MSLSAKLDRVRSIPGLLKNITWLDESPCDVVIYDAEGSDMIQQCIPPGALARVLPIRGGFPLIKSWKFAIHIVINALKYRRPVRSMVISVLRVWNPKVAITHIDNSRDLGELKRIFPKMAAISVQNGSRNDFMSPSMPALRFDHYFSFGDAERDMLANGGHHASKVYAVGSLAAGIFARTNPRTQQKAFDLCFISEFVVDSERANETDDEYRAHSRWINKLASAMLEAHGRLFKVVAQFAEANGLALCVAMRNRAESPNWEEERRYFARLDGKRVPRMISRSGFSSYEAVRMSKLTVTLTSTLGYEALGLGERVIIGADVETVSSLLRKDPSGRRLTTDRLPDCQRLHTLGQEEFSAKAKALLSMTEQAYDEYSKEARAYHMKLDVSHPPQEIIKEKIAGFLECRSFAQCAS